MGGIRANIKYLEELSFDNFEIPFYQRPYRWQSENVETLLNSIRDNLHKEEYRIGSIILHNDFDTEKLNIVDGQQRLTTLSLIFMCLDENTLYRLKSEYHHMESRQNIYQNYRCIKQWFEKHKIDKKQFYAFLLKNCSMVVIVSDDLSEAFQMFDSQNGRGKELEAYNLLKAYHLHAIDNEDSQIQITDEKKIIDRKWEEAVVKVNYGDKKPLLKYIINELFRIRHWIKKNPGYSFSKANIKEFKGIQFSNKKPKFPLYNRSFLLYLYFQANNNVAHRSENNSDEQNPFVSINMDMINGVVFFSYIRTYVAAYEYLFQNDIVENNLQLAKFREDVDTYCFNYSGAGRDGDRYIREVFIALVMAVYDRFGEEMLFKWYPTLYKLSYRKRLEMETVFQRSLYDDTAFEQLYSAIDETGLDNLLNISSEPIKCKRLGPKEERIVDYILMHGGEIIIEKSELQYKSRQLKLGEVLTKGDLNYGEK